MASIPICPYCNNPAVLITGAQLYRGRPDLSNVKIWQCQPCDAHVGCHTSEKMPKNTPYGPLANKELRELRIHLRAKFDPFWINSPTPQASKLKANEWLAEALNIHPNNCYVANFDERQCRTAITACCTRTEMNRAKKQHKRDNPGVPFKKAATDQLAKTSSYSQRPSPNLPF